MKLIDDIFIILDRAIEVFGDYQKAKIWLYTKNKAMGNMPPINASTQNVLDELDRIENGVLT